MGAVLNQPFVSEAYDRLVEAQAAHAVSLREERALAAIDSGEKLRAARTELGLTQAALGERLALTGTFIGMMERGSDKIEARTDLSIRYLLVEHRS